MSLDQPSPSSQLGSPIGVNPFSTSFIRPGAQPFCFFSSGSAEQLVRQLRGQGWRGQIIGPHGCGKSTLIHTLLPHLQAAVGDVRLLVLHQGQRRLPAQALSERSAQDFRLLVVDGFEQLSWWRRRQLIRRLGRQRWGLLVTAHRDVGLPWLLRIDPCLKTAQQIVQRLLPEKSSPLSAADIALEFHAAQGNVREMLFRLYDVCERKSFALEEKQLVDT